VSLPSVVTVGSLGFVLVAGVGLAVASADAVHSPSDPHPAAAPSTTRVAQSPSRLHRDVAPPSEAGRTKAAPHKHSSPRTNPAATPNVLVEVYNNTSITGLAAQKASALKDAGWNVAAVANWYGNIPTDTVYFPPQLHAAAKKLARTLHITRLRPAVAPMQFDRLTLILATG
jgi:hypothetical protein